MEWKMKRLIDLSETCDADLREMLEHARITPRLPDEVRARAHERARAFLTAAAATPPWTVARRARRVRLAFAVSVALVGGTVGAAAGTIASLRSRAPRASAPPPLSIADVGQSPLIGQA